MKILTYYLYVINVMEELTGLDLLSKADVRITARKLVAGEKIVQPILSEMIDENTMRVKLASIYDSFVIDDPKNDVLVQAPEGTVFIGDAERCRVLAATMGFGRLGYVAEGFRKPGDFSRAFWVTEVDHSGDSAYDFLSGKPIEPDGAAAAEPNPEAEKPARPRRRAGKPGDKPAEKPEAEPAKDPAEPPTEKPEAEPAAEPASDAAEPPVEKPAKPKKAAEPKTVPIAHREDEVKKPTLEELIALASSGSEDEAAEGEEAAPEGEDADEGEETAEQTCRRLCKEEGIAYDIEKHGQRAEDGDCGEDADGDADA